MWRTGALFLLRRRPSLSRVDRLVKVLLSQGTEREFLHVGRGRMEGSPFFPSKRPEPGLAIGTQTGTMFLARGYDFLRRGPCVRMQSVSFATRTGVCLKDELCIVYVPLLRGTPAGAFFPVCASLVFPGLGAGRKSLRR